MFDETLASRVARLEEAYQAAKDAYEADGGAPNRYDYAISVRKLALLKVEQALLIANFFGH